MTEMMECLSIGGCKAFNMRGMLLELWVQRIGKMGERLWRCRFLFIVTGTILKAYRILWLDTLFQNWIMKLQLSA